MPKLIVQVSVTASQPDALLPVYTATPWPYFDEDQDGGHRVTVGYHFPVPAAHTIGPRIWMPIQHHTGFIEISQDRWNRAIDHPIPAELLPRPLGQLRCAAEWWEGSLEDLQNVQNNLDVKTHVIILPLVDDIDSLLLGP